MKDSSITRDAYRLSLDDAAALYDKFSNFIDEPAVELSERLQALQLNPERIVESGCRTGTLSRILRSQSSDASIFALDESVKMASHAKEKLNDNKTFVVVSDMDCIPLNSNSVDLVVSNLASSFYAPDDIFSEYFRVLRPDGILMFSMFGPKSFNELRSACMDSEDIKVHLSFSDMHDLGDLLLAAGFTNPVVDVESTQHHFHSVKSMVEHLKNAGILSVLLSNIQLLSLKSVQSKLEDGFSRITGSNSEIGISLEIIYGISWKKRMETGTANVLFHAD